LDARAGNPDDFDNDSDRFSGDYEDLDGITMVITMVMTIDYDD
jgi:hypothetical protein